MSRLTVQALLALILTGTLTFGLASGPVIGIATATGHFQMDNSQVQGNATLFDGAKIQTGEASSRLRLQSGARIELGPESRAVVFGDRLLLEQGLGELEATSAYRIEARTLRISTADPKSIARVRLDGGKAVLVAAVNGPLRVYNRIGLLVANLNAGATLSFEPQAGQDESFSMAGCLLKKNGKYVLVDQTANQVVELRGTDFDQHLGDRIQVAGTAFRGATPVAGASQVIQVKTVETVAKGGCLAVANQIGADTPKATAGGEVHNSHTGAIIAGVVIAAGAGVGAAVALGGKKNTSP